MTASPPDAKDGQAEGPVAATDELPLRVSTLEIFFDLVFAFTLTQLASVLATRLSWLAAGQVVLVFGLLWWMYGAYAWLTNSRPPARTAERLLLLVGMAGFLVVGLAIPAGFGGYGVVLGLGYLVVVIVHAVLYYRVNANILRVAPFNVGSALLVTAAGLLHTQAGTDSTAAYLLWILALAVQLGSPLIVRPGSFFELRPEHLAERHNALLIVAIGESVAAVGIGAAGPVSQAPGISWRLLVAAVLGLAVAAALWWLVFGGGDEERAERALVEASGRRRTQLALRALFYGYIPLLLGLVAMAAAILMAVVQAAGHPAATSVLGAGAGAGQSVAARTGQAAVLAGGTALFLTGDVLIRQMLRTGPTRLRIGAAIAALATMVVGVVAGLDVQLLLVAGVLMAPLIAERGAGGGEPTPGDAAG
jgi:low temperature requirement protein LtrA